jgi:hypothetical protein
MLDTYDSSRICWSWLSQYPISWLEKVTEEIIFRPPVFEKATWKFCIIKKSSFWILILRIEKQHKVCDLNFYEAKRSYSREHNQGGITFHIGHM